MAQLLIEKIIEAVDKASDLQLQMSGDDTISVMATAEVQSFARYLKQELERIDLCG